LKTKKTEKTKDLGKLFEVKMCFDFIY